MLPVSADINIHMKNMSMLQQFLPQIACSKTRKKMPGRNAGRTDNKGYFSNNQNRSSSPVVVMMRIASDNRPVGSAIGC